MVLECPTGSLLGLGELLVTGPGLVGSLRSGLLLGKQDGVDSGKTTTLGDGHAAKELINV